MSDELLIAIISGFVAIISGFMSSYIGSTKAIAYVEKTQAVLDTKLEDLTREVREHNNFAKRMPVVEEQVKIINHRINNLEKNKDGSYLFYSNNCQTLARLLVNMIK